MISPTPSSTEVLPTLAVVLIGRNEGTRLLASLASVRSVLGPSGRLVYVDSGSTDGSLDAARVRGAEVVELDPSAPFTAARARNAGLNHLRMYGVRPRLIQFMDGDCLLQPGWIALATAFLAAHPRAAVACGRRRERTPNASVWNRLCDREWNTPVGKVKSCGGDALMRMEALDEVGGYTPHLIAGEEPEMCVRLRAKGWEVWRLNVEMTLHDADMMHFSQWWKRMRRGGHAAVEGMMMHGRAPERHCVAQVRRALLWGLMLPSLSLGLALALSPWALLLLLAYPAQVFRLVLRFGGRRGDWEEAFFLTLSKFAEVTGIAEWCGRRLVGKPSTLIEYK